MFSGNYFSEGGTKNYAGRNSTHCATFGTKAAVKTTHCAISGTNLTGLSGTTEEENDARSAIFGTETRD
jgi:hypothetical protein